MKYYELTINTKEADTVLEKVIPYLPNPAVWQQKSSAWLSLQFYAEPEKIAELEKKLKENSLKYLLLSKESAKKTAARPARPRKIIGKPKAKVELKEIEEKLEEILRE